MDELEIAELAARYDPSPVAAALAKYNQSNFDVTGASNEAVTLGKKFGLTSQELAAAAPVFGDFHKQKFNSGYTEGSNYSQIAQSMVQDALKARGGDPSIAADPGYIAQGANAAQQRWQGTQEDDDMFGGLMPLILAGAGAYFGIPMLSEALGGAGSWAGMLGGSSMGAIPAGVGLAEEMAALGLAGGEMGGAAAASGMALNNPWSGVVDPGSQNLVDLVNSPNLGGNPNLGPNGFGVPGAPMGMPELIPGTGWGANVPMGSTPSIADKFKSLLKPTTGGSDSAAPLTPQMLQMLQGMMNKTADPKFVGGAAPNKGGAFNMQVPDFSSLLKIGAQTSAPRPMSLAQIIGGR